VGHHDDVFGVRCDEHCGATAGQRSSSRVQQLLELSDMQVLNKVSAKKAIETSRIAFQISNRISLNDIPQTSLCAAGDRIG
jgi:hypothetical protein